MKLPDITLLIATAVAALMAGLFFAYTVSVSPGLGRLPNIEYLKAMQSINSAIQNAVFFLCFFGALILLPLSAVQQFKLDKMVFVLLLAASFCYIIGVFLVTVSINVPLNEMLDKYDPESLSSRDLNLLRGKFEGRWNTWNNVRTFASFVAVILAIAACMIKKNTPQL